MLRLSSRVLIEAHDEWQDSDRRDLSEESMALLNPPAPTVLEPKDHDHRHDPGEGDRRYGIVALTRTAARDELHQSTGRDQPGVCERRDVHPVVELELALLTPSVRRSRKQLESLLDPEFCEVGASGRLWTREEIIAALVDGEEGGPIEAVQIAAREVTPDVVVVTFLTDPGGRAAHRTSLWRRQGGRWRMLHHQGTLLPTST